MPLGHVASRGESLFLFFFFVYTSACACGCAPYYFIVLLACVRALTKEIGSLSLSFRRPFFFRPSFICSGCSCPVCRPRAISVVPLQDTGLSVVSFTPQNTPDRPLRFDHPITSTGCHLRSLIPILSPRVPFFPPRRHTPLPLPLSSLAASFSWLRHYLAILFPLKRRSRWGRALWPPACQ